MIYLCAALLIAVIWLARVSIKQQAVIDDARFKLVASEEMCKLMALRIVDLER